jgi:hypothetical protein
MENVKKKPVDIRKETGEKIALITPPKFELSTSSINEKIEKVEQIQAGVINALNFLKEANKRLPGCKTNTETKIVEDGIETAEK